jgi:GTP-binding protein YchF
LVKKQSVKTGKHPFTTIEPNKGAVDVPDETLDELALLMDIVSRKTPVKLTFVDIAGLIKGAHKGEGLGNQFLHHIREVDLVLHVVREFEDRTVAHIHEKIDPKSDLEIVRTELILKDLETVKKQLADKKSGWIREIGKKGEKILGKIRGGLNRGEMVRNMDLSEEEREVIGNLFLLTNKPEIIVWNLGENQGDWGDLKSGVKMCAKLEEELAGLPWAEQKQYLKEFNLPEPALNRVIKACYNELELLTFYTIAGGKETRAWAVEKGTTAYQAAGKIHTDMQKGFIKIEVINADTLLRIGSWGKAKEKGMVKLHGRDYFVKDRDVLEIKFN